MDTACTLEVTPTHVRDGWILVLEFATATDELVTVSILTDAQAARLPFVTETSQYVHKKLGTVLAREAPGCFAGQKTTATLTFDRQTGRVTRVR